MFKPCHIEVFMGGDFRLDNNPKTVGELRKWIKDMDEELSGWGNETEISEVHIHQGQIAITLTEGIQ